MTGRILWCLGISVGILSLALAGSIGIIAWRLVREENTEEDFDLQEAFPGYFRTTYEQTVFVQDYQKSADIPPTRMSGSCTYRCPGQIRTVFKTSTAPIITRVLNRTSVILRRKREMSRFKDVQMLTHEKQETLRRMKREPDSSDFILNGPVYHSCCRSWRVLTAPETANSTSGEEVELVQTDLYKQYFVQDHCEQANRNCDCQCDTIPEVKRAVCYKDKNAVNIRKKYYIVPILLDGCCKCFNTLLAG